MVCGSIKMASIMPSMSKVYWYVSLWISKQLFMKNSSACMCACMHARVLMVWLDAIFTLFDVDGITLSPWLSTGLALGNSTNLRLFCYCSSRPLTTTTIDAGFLSYCKWLISSQPHHWSFCTQSRNNALDTVHHLTLMPTPSHGQLWFDQEGGSIMGCSFFLFSCFHPSV
jgi:hypothetical protein